MLRASASADMPGLWFVLAETYDPLVAANDSQNTAGAGASENLKAADIKFARYYYQRALTYGVSEARSRLDALEQR